MLVKIKGIHRVKREQADGSVKVHYYAWRGGPPMTAKPHTEEFAIEHARLKDLAQEKTIDTIETLIDRFTGPEHKRNPDFLSLADSTQEDHLYAFKLIRREWPSLPLKLTQQKGMKAEIRKWHRSFAANPRKADKLLFSLSRVFSYAIADELIEKNPCSGVERLYNGSRRESVWSLDQISTFRTNAPQQLLLPFEIAIHTGQRQGDILRLTWNQYDGIYLKFEQNKSRKGTASGKRLKVKVHAHLKGLLNRLDKESPRLLLNSQGRPWTSDGFRSSWAKELTRLKIEDVTFHDLRGTFITERSREGSSIEDISRISGHSISEIKSGLEKHYLATDQDASDGVILRMEKNP